MTRPAHRRKAAAAAALLGAAALALSACGGSDDAPTGATRTVTDATGAHVKVPEHPQRVVTLSELDLDTVLDLGVQPVGLSAGRGQQTAPHYLAARAADVPVVGQVTGPDMDKVVAARPDLILAGQVSDQQVLGQLRKIAPTVVTFRQNEDWQQAVTRAGDALGRSEAAAKTLSSYRQHVTATRTALGAHAHDVVSVGRWAGGAVSELQQGVFASDVLKDLGVERPADQAKQGAGHSTPLSSEALPELDGDHLFIGTLDPAQAASLRTALKGAAFQQVPCVKAGAVTLVDGSEWTSLGGPTAANDILDQVQKALTA